MATRRPIRRKRLLQPNGLIRFESATVPCPVAGKLEPLLKCRNCPAFVEMPRDRDDRAGFIICTPPTRDPHTAPAPDTLLGQLGAAIVGELMTQDLSCVTPDTRLEDVIWLFDERRIGAAPVLDASGALMGIVTKTDLAQDTLEAHPHPSLFARDIMTQRPLVILESDNLVRAISLFNLAAIHHLPVLNEANELVGILSTSDVIGWLGRQCP